MTKAPRPNPLKRVTVAKAGNADKAGTAQKSAKPNLAQKSASIKKPALSVKPSLAAKAVKPKVPRPTSSGAQNPPAPEMQTNPGEIETKGIGARGLHIRVKKKAGTIKESSRRWLTRHMNDPYVHRSRAEGMRSRAAYKLSEINDRYNILSKGDRVIDLGAAPGGWCQVAAQICGSSDEIPRVVGIDFLEIAPMPGVTLLLMDFLDEQAPQAVLDALDGPPDLVLSDMAAPTTGHRRTDHMRTMHLCEVAAQFAIDNLKPGGHFLSKTFQGGTENVLLDMLKKNFRTVHHVKPPASRQESVELYILAKGFKGRSVSADDTSSDA